MRNRRFRRAVVPVVSALAVVGLAACDPPLPPDGRDLGLVLDSAPPAQVAAGGVVEVSGSITNHGTVAAAQVSLDYAVTGGFTVDSVDLGGAGSCTSVTAAHISCSLSSPLEPGATVELSTTATAAAVPGTFTHVLGVGSDGTEPSPDVNAGLQTFAVQVMPAAAAATATDIGNGTNYLGTGHLLSAAGVPGYENEEVYLSVNPYCTDKVNGDRYQSGYSGNTCAGTVNDEYRSQGYTYAIDVPEGRTRSTDVLVYDARYNDLDAPTGETVTTCGGWQWPTIWTEVPADGPRTFTVTDDTQYQFRELDGITWSTTTTVLPAGTHTVDHDRGYRYRTRFRVCTESPVVENPIDSYRQQGAEQFTFSLYAADSTPIDSDNPLVCTMTFQADTPFYGGKRLGSARWNRLCQIDLNMPPGRYLVRVRNAGTITAPEGDGSNQFGILAAPSGVTDPADLLCRSGQPGCAVVSAPGEISIRVAANANVSRIGIGSVGAEHEGRELQLDLYDPGEGGRYLRVLRPTGPNSWAPATVTWSSPGVAGSPGTTTNIAVSASGVDRFNGRLLSIRVDLTGYVPPAGNDRWLVEYEFAGGGVTDRTTWNVVIADRPAP